MHTAARQRILVVVAACAALSAACRESVKATPAAPADGFPDSVAQVGFGVRFAIATAGVRRAELLADTVLFTDAGSTAEVRGVRVTFYSAAGDTLSALTAQGGTYDLARQRLVLRGDVAVRTRDGRELTAPRLAYDAARARLTGDTAFVYAGSDRRLTATAFEAGPALRDVREPADSTRRRR